MLISRVEDEMSAEGRQPAASDAHEYQTASELFDLMAKNHPFEDVSETLSTRDLVILYKNIDLGSKLMSNAEQYKLTKRPNQHVETVVYNEDPDSEGSDISEIYGTEDINDVFAINNERLDLLNSGPSLANTLCQKLGDLEIQTSNLSFQYDQHFLFKDPYIKEQLKNLGQFEGDLNGSVLPASLLDYICCKRLEDNYNFYMENIIRYVKHTIEQLKRISNGDYLTDRAKEKWREVEDVAKEDDNTKVLAASTSIPLQVERKVNGLSTTWDDIIHSEVDIRSLSKILEKKIIVEVPKLICGSYKIFSKLCTDNLVISCKRDQPHEAVAEETKESRVDVVLQLGRSESGQVVSNISSIMILQPTSPIIPVDCPKVLPLLYKESDEEKVEKKKVKIIEIPEIKEESNESASEEYNDLEGEERNENRSPIDEMEENINFFNESKDNSMVESVDSSVALRDILDTRAIPDVLRKEAPYDFISADDLSLSMHKLNMSSLPEETSEDMALNPINKKKSSVKVRIKSPYENKSYIIEEKKRKKLLEIRERREKTKMAVGENCKITKHRYGKGFASPQPSSSVTKLSITNKSFYNSIYGQNLNLDKQTVKSKVQKIKRGLVLGTPPDQLEGELESPMLTPEKNNQKYVNRSYYLDEAVTEMMYTEMKHSECSSGREMFSGSASAVSAEFSANMNIISQIISSPGREIKEVDSANIDIYCFEDKQDLPINEEVDTRIKIVSSSRSLLNVHVPSNSPKCEEEDDDEEENNKGLPTVECRKSIDKLYDLMKKIRKIEPLTNKSSRCKLFGLNKFDFRSGQENSTIQGSESGTSIKHHLTSSNPSSFSFEKINNTDENTIARTTSTKKTNALTTVVPKVIISTKQQPVKIDFEKARKDRKKVVTNPLSKDNPLKAISQLLHEFDSVQKTRHKPSHDPKLIKKTEIPSEIRNLNRPGSLKRQSRLDQPLKEGRDKEVKGKDSREVEMNVAKNVKVFFAKERRPKPNPAMEPLKIPHQQIPFDERHLDRVTKKKIADILDEVKEAKGEAVRGPSKPNSRLNSLAQPKKSYVQAHSEEYQTKYGKNLMADRLQRLASTAPAPGLAAKPKPRPRSEVTSTASVRPPPVQPLERASRPRRAASPDEPAPPAPPLSRPTDAPDAMKNKMVAVESYVKSHYGRTSPSVVSNDLLKARIPLVPTDLDIASLPSSPTGEESAAIGNKLHHIISMMNPKPLPPLSALLEAHETSSKHSEHADALSASLADDQYSREPASSIDSDYRADIFEDKNVKTAVQKFNSKPEAQDYELDSDKYNIKYDEDSCNSSVELQKLEEAFQYKTPVGTMHKRLRLKNLTLTPKHSMRQLMVLESGDTGSLILKSKLSKSSKMSFSHSDNDIRTLASLGKACLDWKFSNIPVQVATVGYAFPEYNAAVCESSTPIKSLDNIFNLGISVSSISTGDNKKFHKTNQCFKGFPQSQCKHDVREIAVGSVTNTEEVITLPPNKKHCTTVSVATDVFVNHVGEVSQNLTNLSDVNRSLKEFEEINIKANRENVDCTSSLDMLVGILNEIQKITTCHITNTDIYADEQECDELTTLLSNDVALVQAVENNESRELVSITSLDKLRQLESRPSIYSLYVSNDGKDSFVGTARLPRLNMSAKSVLCDSKPDCSDKEVSADFPIREFTNTFTDVPSKFFPVMVTHSTNASNSLVGVISKPSSHTVVCVQDYDILDSSFRYEKKIVEITDTPKSNGIKIQKPTIKCAKTVKKEIKKCEVVVEKKMSGKVRKVVTEINLCSDETKLMMRGEFDPMMKVKRDILVTVYSMLVLTVFAALSFPELLYHD